MLEWIASYRHAVDEFPASCVKKLLETVRTRGIQGLLENKIDSLLCLSLVIAWALGKLKDDTDDGVIFAEDAGEQDAYTALAAECCQVLGEGLDPLPAEGPITNALVQRLLQLAIAYVLAILEDSDKLQQFADQVLEWLKNRF